MAMPRNSALSAVGADGHNILELLVIHQQVARRTYRTKPHIHVFEHAILAGENAAPADLQGAVFGPQIMQRIPQGFVDVVAVGALQDFYFFNVLEALGADT